MGTDAAGMTPEGVAERTRPLRVNGLRLFCREWGKTDAPPLVLLHGLRGFSGTWRALAAALAGQFRLIAFDQRGRGESDWDPGHNYYTDAYLSDLEGVVDQLGLARFGLIGHSMGGTTSYVYAARHPERLAALVIEDIVPGSSASGAGAARIVREMKEMPSGFESWAAARQYWRALRPSLSESAIEQRVIESLREEPDGRIGWRHDAEGIRQTRIAPDPARMVDLWPVVERIKTPTLVIRGERSDFSPASTVSQMCACNPNIRAVSVAAAGHYVHDDAPAEFLAQVRDFLVPLLPRWA